MKRDKMLNALEKLRLTNGSVMVIGDVILDIFKFGHRERTSSEANVPVIKVDSRVLMPGGAGNVAANIVSLGGNAKLVSVIGAGHSGRELIEMLDQYRIDTTGLIIDQSRPTTRKERILNQNEQIACLANETRDSVQPWVIEKVVETVAANGSAVIVITDYNRGMISEDLIRKSIATSSAAGKKVITDVHVRNGFDADCLKGAYLIKPNRLEVTTLIGGKPPNGHAEAEKAAIQLARRYQCNVLLTRDHEGMTLAFPDGEVEHFPALEKEPVCVSGAGDTVVGTIALGLASDLSLREAVILGCVAAAVVVKKPGTATVSPDEIKAMIENRFE